MTTPAADPAALARAAGALRAGRLALFPTETVFGVGADLFSEAAVDLLYRVKRRPRSRPLLAHVRDAVMARRLVCDWPARAQALTERFWPGPLALILPRAAGVPDTITAGGTTVGLRCPDHPVALALIEALGGPIAGTSANEHGEPPASTIHEARRWFPQGVVEAVDGPPAPAGAPSTVLLLGEDSSADRILREGPITAEMLGLE